MKYLSENWKGGMVILLAMLSAWFIWDRVQDRQQKAESSARFEQLRAKASQDPPGYAPPQSEL